VHPVATSDDLAELRKAIEALPALAHQIGQAKVVRLVLDANLIIGDIRWLVKKRTTPGARTALQEALASRTIAGFAPSFLDDEVRKELASVARDEELSVDAMFAEWAWYRERITFYEAARPTEEVRADPGTADPKDLPYVETYLAVGAAGIVTADSDLSRMRTQTVRIEIVLELRSYARAAAVELTIKFGGVVLGTVGMAAAVQLISAFGWIVGAFRRLSPALQLITTAAILAALLHRPARERLLGLLSRGWCHFVDALKVLAPAFVELEAEARDAKSRAETAWQEIDAAVPARRIPLRAHALAACAASPSPLTEAEIHKCVERAGTRTSSPSFRSYLRRVLRHHPDLFEHADGRWTVARVPRLAN
jgi:predicted nucleic acid-binding protein